MTTRPAELARRLRKVITGRTVVPGDGEYDRLRMVFYGGIDSRPRPANESCYALGPEPSSA